VAASLDKKRLDALLLTISVPAGRDQACEGLAQLAVDVNILGRKAVSMHEIFLHCLLGTIFAVPECGCCMFVPAHDSEALSDLRWIIWTSKKPKHIVGHDEEFPAGFSG
jgi:hypothetical protein